MLATGPVAHVENADSYVFSSVTCVTPKRVVELRTLGICGRLQPKLLKSRRREVRRFFLSRPPHVTFAQSGSKRPQVAEQLALRFFICPFSCSRIRKNPDLAAAEFLKIQLRRFKANPT
jgi:hypothetical protein